MSATIGAGVAFADSVLALLTPVVLGGAPAVEGPSGDAAWHVRTPSRAPLLLLLVVALVGGGALIALWQLLRAPETLESALIVVAEMGGDFEDLDSVRAQLLDAAGPAAGGQHAPSRAARAADIDLALSPELLAAQGPVVAHETACDVRQKGSIETMSTVLQDTPKPYPVEKLLLAQQHAAAAACAASTASAQPPRDANVADISDLGRPERK